METMNLANPEPAHMRREFVRCTWSIFFAVGIFIALAGGIVHCWHPDIAAILEKAQQLTAVPVEDFQPEPVEKLLYTLALLTIPFLLAAGYWLTGRLLQNKGPNVIWGAYAITLVTLAVLLWVGVEKLLIAPVPNSQLYLYYYTWHLLWMEQIYIYTFFAYPIFLYVFFRVVPSVSNDKLNAVMRWLVSGVLLLAILYAALPCIFSAYSLDPYGFSYSHDFDPVFAPSVFVQAGCPLLTDLLQNNYGLYPHFLNPIFKLIGLNVFHFTSVMAVLSAMSFLFYFLSMRLMVRSLWLLFLGFITFLYLAAFAWGRNIFFTPFFQMVPLRVIFPACALFLVALYLIKEKKHLYYPIHTINAIAVLWNPETGILLVCCWFFLLGFQELFGNHWKQILIKILRHAIIAVAFVLSALALYALLIRIGYGRFPDLRDLFCTLRMVSLGCFMLPMPLQHPWVFVILPYLAGLLLAVRSVLRRTPSPETAFILYCTLWGCATFGYYLGRSHNMNLISVGKESVFVAVLLTQRYWQMIQTDKPKFFSLPHAYLLLALALYVLPIAVLEIPATLQHCTSQMQNRLQLNYKQEQRAAQNIAFIQKHTQPGEEVLIFSENNGAYYAETKTRPAMKILLIDMFRQEQWNAMCRILDQPHPPKIFFENLGFYHQKKEIEKRLEQQVFQILDKNQHMQLLGPVDAKNTK